MVADHLVAFLISILVFLTGLQVWRGGALDHRATLQLRFSSCMCWSLVLFLSSCLVVCMHLLFQPHYRYWPIFIMFERRLRSHPVTAVQLCLNVLGICCGRGKWKHLFLGRLVWALVGVRPSMCIWPRSTLLWLDQMVALEPCPHCVGVVWWPELMCISETCPNRLGTCCGRTNYLLLSPSKLFGWVSWSDHVIAFGPCPSCLGECCVRNQWLHLDLAQVVWANVVFGTSDCIWTSPKLFGRMLCSEPVIAFGPCPNCLGEYCVRNQWLPLDLAQIVWANVVFGTSDCIWTSPKLFGRMLCSEPVIAVKLCARLFRRVLWSDQALTFDPCSNFGAIVMVWPSGCIWPMSEFFWRMWWADQLTISKLFWYVLWLDHVVAFNIFQHCLCTGLYFDSCPICLGRWYCQAISIHLKVKWIHFHTVCVLVKWSGAVTVSRPCPYYLNTWYGQIMYVIITMFELFRRLICPHRTCLLSVGRVVWMHIVVVW